MKRYLGLCAALAFALAACATAVMALVNSGTGVDTAERATDREGGVPDSKRAQLPNREKSVVKPLIKPLNRSPDASTADFNSRVSGPGVVRWFAFDDPASLNGGRNYAVMPGDATTPSVDTLVKASGAGSLRFDIPPRTGGNAAGAFYFNFSQDLSIQFGENSEFYFQWRQRWNKAMLTTQFRGIDGGITSFKTIDLTTGDTPNKQWNSCEAIELVITSFYSHAMPIMYNSCTGSRSHAAYSGLTENSTIAGEFILQNSLNCLYSTARSVGITDPLPNCFPFLPDEWMTFEVHVKLGPRNLNSNDWDDSIVEYWGAREGGDPVKIIDWRPGVRGYFPLAAGLPADNQKYGKVYLLPYMTNKDPSQVHDLAQTWYDEAIVSRDPIPFPGNKPITPR